MSTRLDSIRERWDDERKISGGDVRWLLDMAKKAETLQAADALRRAGKSNRDAFFDGLFGGAA